HRSQFPIRQRSQEGQDAADHPDQQGRSHEAARLSQDTAGHQEDSRPDNGTDDDEDEVTETEYPREGRFGFSPLCFHPEPRVREIPEATPRLGPQLRRRERPPQPATPTFQIPRPRGHRSAHRSIPPEAKLPTPREA